MTFFSFLICYSIIRGDIIRKNIGIIVLALALGLVFSKAMFTSYENEKVMTSDGNIYLLQYGSFINKEVMNENIKKLDNYLIYENENKYYVHLGIFTNLETAMKMQKYLENKNIYTYIKNDYLGDNDLINQIDKLDKELLLEEDSTKIMEINNQILNFFKK